MKISEKELETILNINKDIENTLKNTINELHTIHHSAPSWSILNETSKKLAEANIIITSNIQ